MQPKPLILPLGGFEKTRPNKHRAVLIWQDRVGLNNTKIIKMSYVRYSVDAVSRIDEAIVMKSFGF